MRVDTELFQSKNGREYCQPEKSGFNAVFPLIIVLLLGETLKDRTPRQSIAILLI